MAIKGQVTTEFILVLLVAVPTLGLSLEVLLNSWKHFYCEKKLFQVAQKHLRKKPVYSLGLMVLERPEEIRASLQCNHNRYTIRLRRLEPQLGNHE